MDENHRIPCVEHEIVTTPPAAHAAEGASVVLDASSLSLLISRYSLRDGEIIELVIRPSVWWIIFNAWRTLLLAGVIALAGLALWEYLPGRRGWYIEAGILVGSVRLMWATIRWMSRIHLLTNMRVLTISGVFNATVVECPLRRVARVRSVSSHRERLLMLGSIEVIPLDEKYMISLWQTIRRPREVMEQIVAAMNKARQCGGSSGFPSLSTSKPDEPQ